MANYNQNQVPKWLRISLIVILSLILVVTVVILVANAIIRNYAEQMEYLSTENKSFVTNLIPSVTETLPSQPTLTDPYVETNEDSGDRNENNLPEIVDTKDVKNILLIATDARTETEAGRSDTMILVSLNEKTKKIVLCSFARDIAVDIPGRGTDDGTPDDKLTHAHAYGGYPLVLETFEHNFNIKVDHMIRVTFQDFVKVVDAVGGLDIAMTYAEIKTMNWYLLEINEILGRPAGTGNLTEISVPNEQRNQICGTFHLDGAQALGYARNRYDKLPATGGVDDFARTDRQRLVIGMVMDKIKNMSIGELDAFLETCLPLIEHNIPDKMMDTYCTVQKIIECVGYERVSMRFPSRAWNYGHVGKMSVIKVDFQKNCEALYRAIYDQDPPQDPPQDN